MDLHTILWAKSQESSSAHLTTNPVLFPLLMADLSKHKSATSQETVAQSEFKISEGHLLKMYIPRPPPKPPELEPQPGDSEI